MLHLIPGKIMFKRPIRKSQYQKYEFTYTGLFSVQLIEIRYSSKLTDMIMRKRRVFSLFIHEISGVNQWYVKSFVSLFAKIYTRFYPTSSEISKSWMQDVLRKKILVRCKHIRISILNGLSFYEKLISLSKQIRILRAVNTVLLSH